MSESTRAESLTTSHNPLYNLLFLKPVGRNPETDTRTRQMNIAYRQYIRGGKVSFVIGKVTVLKKKR